MRAEGVSALILVVVLLSTGLYTTAHIDSSSANLPAKSSSFLIPAPLYDVRPDDGRVTQTSASMSLQQNEPSIAINPKKASNMIVGYNDASPSPACPRAHYSVTTNGGVTWTSGTPLPTTGLTTTTCNPPKDTPAGFTCCDTAVAFNDLGDALLVTMTWPGKLNGGYYNEILLYTSTPDGSGNAGSSWRGPYIVGGGGSEFEVDKPALAVDRTGGANNGTVYVAWVNYYIGSAATACDGSPDTTHDRILVSSFTLTPTGVPIFSGPRYHAGVQASDPAAPFNWGPALTVGSSGSLYVAYEKMPNICLTSANSVMISRSDDGGASFPLLGQTVDSSVVPPPSSFPFGAFDAYGSRASALPTVTTISNGTVFVAWTDGGKGDMDIQSRASLTNGATWESRVRVNDIAKNDQFLPVAVTDPNDVIHVFYYSRQSDANNLAGGLYLESSSNGGASFGASNAYSSSFSNPKNVCTMGTPCLWGDYIGASAVGSMLSSTVCAAWADSRDSAMTGDNDANIYSKCFNNQHLYAEPSYWWLISRPPTSAYVPFNICITVPDACVVHWQAEILPTHSTSGFMSVDLTANALPPGVTVTFSQSAGYPPFNATIYVNFTSAQCSDPTTCLQGIMINANDGTNSTTIETVEVLSKVPYLLTDTNVYNPGEHVNLTGAGFTASSAVTVKLDGSTVGSLSTDSTGSFSLRVSLPSSLSIGAHMLTATDSSSKTASTTFASPKIILESEAGGPPIVPSTTSSGLGPSVMMLVALTIGVLTIMPMRRRANRSLLARA